MSFRNSLLVIALLFLAACSHRRALEAACAAGDPAACEDLSARYLLGDGVPVDPARAQQFDQMARSFCADRENATKPGCVTLGQRTTSIALEIPSATAVETVLRVNVGADSALLVNGARSQDDAAFVTQAREAVAKDPHVRAVVIAAPSVPYARVIAVMDLLRQAGVDRIAFGPNP